MLNGIGAISLQTWGNITQNHTFDSILPLYEMNFSPIKCRFDHICKKSASSHFHVTT